MSFKITTLLMCARLNAARVVPIYIYITILPPPALFIKNPLQSTFRLIADNYYTYMYLHSICYTILSRRIKSRLDLSYRELLTVTNGSSWFRWWTGISAEQKRLELNSACKTPSALFTTHAHNTPSKLHV